VSSVLYDVPGPKAKRRVLIGTIAAAAVLLAIAYLVVGKLSEKGQLEGQMWSIFLDPGLQRLLLAGLVNTIKAAVVSIALALVLGALLAVARLSERAWIRIPAVVFVEFFRSIPLVLLILFGFFVYGGDLAFIGTALNANPPDAFAALIVGLVLYNGSVLAEVFRAGIHAVPLGQTEAAYALGMRKSQVMNMILIPQAIRIMLPAIIGQCVVALKDSALGFIIGFEELLRAGKAIYGSGPELGLPRSPIIQTIVVVGTIFVLLNLALGALARWLEGKLARSGRTAARPIGADMSTMAIDAPAGVGLPGAAETLTEAPHDR
jgi:glutamate transport system permease protein